MTVVPVSNVPVVASYEDDDFGLGEVGVSNAMPRLNIVHKEGVFKHSLTGQTHTSLEVIALGVVKNRTLWPDSTSELEKPLCKSNDGKNGVPFNKEFPWNKTNFQRPTDNTESVFLSCEQCPLQAWGADGSKPLCTEVFVLPVLVPEGGDWENLSPALMSFQRSSIKPFRAYTTPFQRSRTPLFSVATKITLDVQRRGTVEFAVPSFSRLEETDPSTHAAFAAKFREIRDYTTRVTEDADVAEEIEQQAQTAPVVQSAADLPF